jgi:hypothetical protein
MALRPDYPEACSNHGLVLQAQGKLEAAQRSLQHALALNPDYAEAHYNLGNILLERRQPENALACYQRAIALKPDLSAAHYNAGNALRDLHRLDAAVASYEKAIALKPDFAQAHCSLSLVQLLAGDLQQGLKRYEWRLRTPQFAHRQRNYPQPAWLGEESPSGKTLFLYGEQGLGDTIQFCRYVPLLAQHGARIILEVEPALASLLAGLAGVAEFVVKGSVPGGFDFHCSLLSLPLACKTGLNSIPSSIPYLSARADKLAYWAHRLGPRVRPRIGLVWSGNPQHKNDHNRSLPLAELIPYLSADFEYFSLQKDVRARDQDSLQAHPEIRHFGAELTDFSDTAALCAQLDLLLSVDSSVAHLNGALGNPTWILLPHTPDWRWLLQRSDSPWYPQARLYRQTAPGDWAGMLGQLAKDLSAGYSR